jgi:hypothetical protein
MEVIKKVNAPWMLSKAAAFPLDPLPELLVFSRFVRQLPDSALAPSAAHEPILAKKTRPPPPPSLQHHRRRLSNRCFRSHRTTPSPSTPPELLFSCYLSLLSVFKASFVASAAQATPYPPAPFSSLHHQHALYTPMQALQPRSDNPRSPYRYILSPFQRLGSV